MIIDTHLHVWEADSPRFPWRPLANVMPDYAWPVEKTVSVMDQHDVFGGVLIQVSLYSFDNRYLVSCGRRYPTRFRLVGMLDPRSETIEFEMEELARQGVCGLRLAPDLREDLPWFNHPAADRLWRKAGEMGMILTLLVNLRNVAEAEKAIRRFPDTTVVVDHLSRPDDFDDPVNFPYANFLRLAQYGNVYAKASALGAMSRQPYPHPDSLEWVRQAFDAFGAQRLMWGTDTPMWQDPGRIPDMVKLVEMALPDASPSDLEAILGGTAYRLFAW